MPKSFTSYAFGCRVNQAEKEALDRQLMTRGYNYDESKPDLYIINTCSVTHKAEREARQKINQVRKQFPDTQIVVTGCAATNWLKRDIDPPDVDHIIDNTSKEFIAEILDKRTKDIPTVASAAKQECLTVSSPSPADQVRDKYISSRRMILKIQDGCHRYCSFCIVPYLRGMPQSVPVQTITKTIQEQENEMQEIILAAINTEAYGRDTGETCIELIDSVLTNTTIKRLSFGSIHPWTLTDQFLEHYRSWADEQRYVDFFHIPLQSGSNKILNLMKRNYTREEFIEKLEKIKQLNSLAFIGTDVVVGFLEETDKDFEDTYQFLEQTPISKFHVFRYSERQHTAAAYLGKRLNEPTADEKKQRSQALIDLGKRKYTSFLQHHVGKTFQTLTLHKTRDGAHQGLLSNQIPVILKGNNHLPGSLIPVQIESLRNDTLIGKAV